MLRLAHSGVHHQTNAFAPLHQSNGRSGKDAPRPMCCLYVAVTPPLHLSHAGTRVRLSPQIFRLTAIREPKLLRSLTWIQLPGAGFLSEKLAGGRGRRPGSPSGRKPEYIVGNQMI